LEEQKMKNGAEKLLLVLATVAMVFGVVMWLNQGEKEETVPATVADIAQQPGTDSVQYTRELGATSTVTFNAYEGEWSGVGSKTEVYPEYTIIDQNSKIVVNDVAVNSTTTFGVGDSGTVYATGSDQYFDPHRFVVGKQAETVELLVYSILATSNLVTSAYDDNEDALTADNNVNNTADYAGGNIGNGDTTYYIKLKNNVKDKVFRLGAILTYYCGGEADDFTLQENGWELTDVPSGVLGDTFTLYDDGNASTSCSFKHAYVPVGEKYIELQEFDDTGKMKFVFDPDDTTEPTANGDTYFGVTFVDYACEKSAGGAVICDWYKHDTDSDPGDVGLDEAPEVSGYKGLTVGVTIEPQ